MERIILWLQKQNRLIYHVLLLVVSSFIILQFLPREAQFKYEFEKGKPWMHEDLIAPFDFPILKSKQELESEVQQLQLNKEYFFVQDSTIAIAQTTFFQERMESVLRKDSTQNGLDMQSLQSATVYLEELFSQGIIEIPSVLENRKDKTIYIKLGNSSRQVILEEFKTINEISESIRSRIFVQDSMLNQELIRNMVYSLKTNVVVDEETIEKNLQAKIELILPNKGAVLKSETIIFQGNIVDDEKLAKLNSLKTLYEGSFWSRANVVLVAVGQWILIFCMFLLLYAVFYKFYPTLLNTNRHISLLLVHTLFIFILSVLIFRLDSDWVYASPFYLLPVVFMSFFDNRISIIASTAGVLLIGFLIPNAFEFIFIQVLMILLTSITYHGFLKRGEFFISILKILGLYILLYICYSLIQEGSFGDIDYSRLILFGVSCLLSLFAIPLLYIYERIFRLISETTLLELSDTNNKLLRQLSEKAPGTFQHTLQVANLAEKGVAAIGGNSLLVRTGALYHDIGKMLRPQYFVENQITGVNPHDELSFKESAKIIISHVIEGIEMARKHRLPEVIIDFIRTHHGTSRVEYFYRLFLKNYPENEDDVKEFTYPGPMPFSKETAVLMMADSIEAASRSLQDKNQESLNMLINNIIDSQLNSQQFDNSNITLRDIKTIKKIFLDTLLNVYHLRIEYPEK